MACCYPPTSISLPVIDDLPSSPYVLSSFPTAQQSHSRMGDNICLLLKFVCSARWNFLFVDFVFIFLFPLDSSWQPFVCYLCSFWAPSSCPFLVPIFHYSYFYVSEMTVISPLHHSQVIYFTPLLSFPNKTHHHPSWTATYHGLDLLTTVSFSQSDTWPMRHTCKYY